MRFETLLLLGSWSLLGGCAESGVAQREALAEHQSQWQARAPADYVVRICGTGFAGGCSLSAVSGGQVVAQQSGFRPQPLEDVTPSAEEPIDRLFARATTATYESGCDVTKLAFDGTFGFVSEYYSDCDEEGSGERVECFEPNTVELAACSMK